MRRISTFFAALLLLAATLPGIAHAAALSTRTQLFYYPWYGSPTVNGSYRHWDQGGHTPPDDVGANYYPSLGAVRFRRLHRRRGPADDVDRAVRRRRDHLQLVGPGVL